MYKRLKENKGITLVSLVILVTVLLIVTSTMVLNIGDKYDSERLDKLASDLQLLTEKTSIYYAKNKNYPILDDEEAESITIGENSVTVDRIDLGKLQGLTLNYGEDYRTSTDDYYGIDTSTGTVYYKKGINGIHNLSKADSVTAIGVAKITAQPQWQTVVEGETATLSVAVDIIEGVTYQWFEADTYEGEGTEIADATANTLTIENVSTDDAKYYYCEITYNGITIKSDVAKVNVN